MAQPSVAFVGVGNIGSPMAMRLAEAGFLLTVCDLHSASLEPFTEKGARTTQKIADCDSDVAIFMVADDKQLLRSIGSSEGLLSRSGRLPSMIVVMSTVAPSTIKFLAPSIAERGIRFCEAPVSGGPFVASRGELSVMFGGDATDLDYLRPILDTMATRIFHCGPLGAGETAKIINNLVGVSNVMLVAEAFQLATASGLDLASLLPIMEESSGRNFFTRDCAAARRMYETFGADEARVRSLIDISLKDMDLALALGAKTEVTMPILRSIRDAAAKMSEGSFFERVQSFVRT